MENKNWDTKYPILKEGIIQMFYMIQYDFSCIYFDSMTTEEVLVKTNEAIDEAEQIMKWNMIKNDPIIRF